MDSTGRLDAAIFCRVTHAVPGILFYFLSGVRLVRVTPNALERCHSVLESNGHSSPTVQR